MNVLQNSRPTKILFHALPHCKAKSTLQLSSIHTNDSSSVEHNSKTLPQNKFNTRQPIQNLTGLCPQILLSLERFYFNRHFSLYASLWSSYLFRRCLLSVIAIERAYIYIDKSHMTTNLLVYAGLNSNFLERALRLNVPEHSTTIEIAKLGQKYITLLLSDEKRKRTRTYFKQ